MEQNFFSNTALIKRKLEHRLRGHISLSPLRSKRGSVLLSYLIHPFRIPKAEFANVPHSNVWECFEMARILRQAGYEVDIIDWHNTSFIPRKHYQVVIDTHQNIDRLSDHFTNTFKILLATGAHWLFQNSSEYCRLLELKNRRGIVLSPKRNVLPVHSVEKTDHILLLGNDFTEETYQYVQKPITRLPVTSITTFENPSTKKWAEIRKNFVWIGGGGSVHKGLDILLDALTELPIDFSLTLCGPLDREFVEAYKHELSSPRIQVLGRINMREEQFRYITKNSIALLHPSCSEGQSTAVVTGLHAGIIPAVSIQSGVTVEPFGYTFRENTKQEIKRVIQEIATLSPEELEHRSTEAWNYARTHHMREHFTAAFTEFVTKYVNPKIS